MLRIKPKAENTENINLCCVSVHVKWERDSVQVNVFVYSFKLWTSDINENYVLVTSHVEIYVLKYYFFGKCYIDQFDVIFAKIYLSVTCNFNIYKADLEKVFLKVGATLIE